MGLALWVSAVISLLFLSLSTVPVLLGFDERRKMYLDICICHFPSSSLAQCYFIASFQLSKHPPKGYESFVQQSRENHIQWSIQ